MVDLIDFQLVEEAAPSLSSTQVERLLDAVNAQVRRVAPCLLDESSPGRPEALQLVFDALRATEGAPPPWLESDTTGPFTARFRAMGARSVLSQAEEGALRALCPAAATTTGTSRASFPPPGPIDRIFGLR